MEKSEMREITEAEKKKIKNLYNKTIGDFEWLWDELTRRGFKIVKEEENGNG